MEEKWDNTISNFVKAISKDTKCTELIKILIENFFYDNSLGIFTLISERSKDILNKDEVDKELKQRRNTIERIKQNLINYRGAPKEGRADHMKNLVELCNSFYNNLVTGKNMDNVQLITIAVTFVFVHLTILRERNRHSKEIYSKENKAYETDLRQKVQDYKLYFISMYDKWEDWRKSFIHIKGLESHPIATFPCLVHDTFHNLYMTYRYPDSTDEAMWKKYQELCNQGQFAFLNEAKDIFVDAYLFTFDLNKFLPNNWSAPPEAHNKKIGTLCYGIVGKITVPHPKEYENDYEEPFKLSSDEPGIITGLNIHYSDVVHGLTVKYKGGVVTSVGNVKGGNATTIRGLDEKNYITSVEVSFNDRVISGLQFNFNGDRSTETLGNNVNAKRFLAGPTTDFRLAAIQMAPSKSYSKKLDCLGYTLLVFEHSRIAKN